MTSAQGVLHNALLEFRESWEGREGYLQGSRAKAALGCMQRCRAFAADMFCAGQKRASLSVLGDPMCVKILAGRLLGLVAVGLGGWSYFQARLVLCYQDEVYGTTHSAVALEPGVSTALVSFLAEVTRQQDRPCWGRQHESACGLCAVCLCFLVLYSVCRVLSDALQAVLSIGFSPKLGWW